MRARSVPLSVAVLVTFALPACDAATGLRPRRDGSADDGAVLGLPDADGDGIPDQYEGRGDPGGFADTDGDGTPDYLDDDSDADGIPDSIEGGRVDAPPVDTDGDGVPDFRDLDSDGNGIPDAAEGGGDLDGDGTHDAADLDDDGDRVRDIDEVGEPSAPADSDGDGTPDYRDTDSDGDTIDDGFEGAIDTDMDAVADRVDLDSDQDSIPDAVEAGDADAATPPIDTDMDGIADFRDPDSDADGLSDSAEAAAGSSPILADSDGDGVTDLVEVASGTSPLDPADSPRARGDFVFFEPYMAPPDPTRDTLDFATSIRSADVYFLIDTTGSMGGAIGNIRTSLSAAGTGIIDRVRATIADTSFGVGDFKDYGDAYVYSHRTDISADATRAQAGVNALAAGGGGDGPEGGTPSLFAAATGMAVLRSAARTAACPTMAFGWPCFRAGAVPIIVLVTDAPTHNGRGGTNAYSGYTDYPTMLAAVTAARIRVIGVAVGTGGLTDLRNFATDSGAVDGAGAPLVTTTTAAGVSDGLIEQIRILAAQTRFDISVEYVDDPGDAIDSFAAFVDHIEANTAGDPVRGCAARPAVDTDGDGYLDTFPGVTAGERVCFDIVVKQNDTVMPTTTPQLVPARLRVLGDGFTELDSRDVYFLVPPRIVPPGGPD